MLTLPHCDPAQLLPFPMTRIPCWILFYASKLRYLLPWHEVTSGFFFFLAFFSFPLLFSPSAPATYISCVNNTMCIRTHTSTELHRPKVLDAGINPFTAQPVKCTGWKMHGRACKQYILRSCNNLLSTLCVLMKILSHTGAKKKKKRLKYFRFRTFIGRFHLVISWG